MSGPIKLKTSQVRAVFVDAEHQSWSPLYCHDTPVIAEAFDRWLASHDRKIRAEAWDEGREAEADYWSYLSEAGGDTEPMFDLEKPTNPYHKKEES